MHLDGARDNNQVKMSIVSYAQNFEDVMLWRALKDIEHGFYIDIGAQDPVIDSVSLAFYEKGWRGLHIEPTLQYSNKLYSARPDEVVEQVAVGDNQEKITLFEFSDTGLSTVDSEIAKRHQEAGFSCVQRDVKVVSLDFILAKYGEKDIHWLKIDVEGSERSVLDSWKTSTNRPWIIVIESTKPLSQEENYSVWEALLLEKEYLFCYFDGVNRFYVHKSREALAEKFIAPPNIFDGFTISVSHPFNTLVASKLQQSELIAAQLATQGHDATVKADEASVRAQLAEVKGQAAEARAQAAEAKMQTAEARAQNAEARAQNAEAKAQIAEARTQDAEAKAQNAEAKVQEAQAKVQEAQAKVQEAQASAQHLEIRLRDAEERARDADSGANRVLMQIHAIHSSASWRATAPLRWVGRLVLNPGQQLRRGANTAVHHAINRCSKPLSKLIDVVLRRPKLSQRMNEWLLKWTPHLQGHLRSIANVNGSASSMHEREKKTPSLVLRKTAETELPPRAEHVLADLRAAIENKNRQS